MEQSSRKSTTTVASERASASERIIGFLRQRYPTKLAENVAADIGVSAAAIRKLEERGSAPSLAVFARMVGVYGPELLHAAFGWDWLDNDLRARRLDALETDIERQRDELQKLRVSA